MATKTRIILTITLELICILLVFLPWIVLHSGVEPYHRGFFCDDESLRHPYKPSTVPSWIVTFLGIGLNVIVVLGAEAVHTFYLKEVRPGYKPLLVRHRYTDVEIHPYILQCYRFIGVFLFGAALQQTITNIGKYSLGRLRPHFFEVCQPDWSTVQCVDENGLSRYVTENVCTGTDSKRLHEVRLSFPSGHSSLSVYCAVFLTVYLQARCQLRFSKLFTHFLQVMLLWLAIGTCVSRISDYKHHWSDVLAGALLGFTVAFVMARYSCGLLAEPSASRVCAEVESLREGIVKPNKTSQEYGTIRAGPQGDREYGASQSGSQGSRDKTVLDMEEP